jgi:adenosylhomocysteine nucleosidase
MAMTLAIKTGMATESDIAARVAPSALVMTGIMTVAELDAAVPPSCAGIISFGVCGGLAPGLAIGQNIIGDLLKTPSGDYLPDPQWRKRLFARTKAYEHVWWSSDTFDTADDPIQREQLLAQTGAWVIDDESMAVAQFAKKRNIPFALMRTVSDGANDTIPAAAREALRANGTTNIWAVLASVLSDPSQIGDLERMANYLSIALGTLYTAGLQVGPTFQGPS